MTAVSKHNDLRDALIAEAARYRTGVDLSGPFTEGDPGHTEVHNEVGRAMLKLRDVANGYGVDPAVVISLPDVANVGDTGHIGDHVLFDDALAVLQAVELPWEA